MGHEPVNVSFCDSVAEEWSIEMMFFHCKDSNSAHTQERYYNRSNKLTKEKEENTFELGSKKVNFFYSECKL